MYIPFRTEPAVIPANKPYARILLTPFSVVLSEEEDSIIPVLITNEDVLGTEVFSFLPRVGRRQPELQSPAKYSPTE